MPIASGGMLFVDIRDAEGNPVVLMPNRRATLRFVLPAGLVAEAGDELDLRYFDDEVGLWLTEGTCRVEEIPEDDRADERTLACAGPVRHFTWWNVDKPEDTACLNLSSVLDVGTRYRVDTAHYELDTCTDQDGTLSCTSMLLDPAERRYREGIVERPVVVLPPDEAAGHPESICRLVDVTDRELVYVVRVYFRVQDLQADLAGDLPDPDWYSWSSEPVGFESIAESLGSQELYAFGTDAETLCRMDTRCVQLPIELTFEELTRIAFTDDDGDGHLIVPSGALPRRVLRHQLGFKIDCDDSNPDVFPGADDSDPCDGVDLDCDGTVELPLIDDGEGGQRRRRWDDTPGSVGHRSGYQYWNGVLCRDFESCIEPADEEIPGNLFDEDCDGATVDADGDGWLPDSAWKALLDAGIDPRGLGYQHGDCSDSDAESNPGETEIPGNPHDEDCDGFAIDADGDGFYDIAHRDHTLLPAHHSGPWDCDDSDDRVNPDANPSLESTFARFFRTDEQGRVHRTIDFCHYVDTRAGSLRSPEADWLQVDFNCDNFSSDLDGDGYTRPGDNSRGKAFAIDCDDLDPRVRPAGPKIGADTPECGLAIPVTQVVNDALCEFNDPRYHAPSGAAAQDIPQCPLTPKGTKTSCQQFLDPDSGAPVDVWGCVPVGAQDRNPPRLPEDGGKLWGPCGLQGRTVLLPSDCSEGACAGPLKVTQEYRDDVNAVLQSDDKQDCSVERCALNAKCVRESVPCTPDPGCEAPALKIVTDPGTGDELCELPLPSCDPDSECADGEHCDPYLGLCATIECVPEQAAAYCLGEGQTCVARENVVYRQGCTKWKLDDDEWVGMCFPRCDDCTGVVCTPPQQPCHISKCVEGDCVTEPSPGPCSDQNECTIGDSCNAGQCASGASAPLGTPCSGGEGTCDGNGRCLKPGCGNGTLDAGEECDDGGRATGDGCDAVCRREPECGNGILDRGEECDQGEENGVGCTHGCTREPVCGNSNLDIGEQCDDGNVTNGDGCSRQCLFESECGDGVLGTGEDCDPQALPEVPCSSSCSCTGDPAACAPQQPICGNRVVEPGEECDEGPNAAVEGGACSSTCLRVPECGNGNTDPGEQCDAGAGPYVKCTPDCARIAECGNGLIEAGEQCDDGGVQSGDGCGAFCQVE